MLRRAASTAVALGLLLLAFAGSGVVAAAGNPVSCSANETWSPVRGTCVVRISAPGRQRAGGTPVAVGRSVRSGGSQPQKCVSKYSTREVPCKQKGASWSNAQGCYVSRADPQPPKSDPVWEGHRDGAIYGCYSPELVGNRLTYQWAAATPVEAPAPPDPRVLAQQAVAAMGLRAIRIGIVPEDRAGSVGLVGLPTWMWAEAPGPSTWGPVTRSVSAGGYTVTATGRVDRVVWAMGDGSTVVCRKAGTPYADSFGKRSSPDCGHTYTRQGTYTVRATSYWVVAWSGIGQSGTIPIDFTESTVITVGEAQVLTQ